VRVTPRTSRESFGPGADGQFAAKLTAPPVDGAANAALIALVAKQFGVARRDVALVSGDTARIKHLFVTGDPAKLAERAASLYGSMP
jgi:uncharacterized protein (TIGR00251 family)